MKILFGYSYFHSDAYRDVKNWNESYLELLRNGGFDVEGFCLTLNPPGPRLSYKELDKRWRWGEKNLMNMYEKLEEKLKNKDVLINSSGINLHPKFVEKLNVFKIFQCFDDPESSDDISKPVAYSYDLCLVGNIAEIDTYKSWGISNVEWIPLGLLPGFYDKSIDCNQIMNENRDIDLFMMIDKENKWRKNRLDQLDKSFPNAYFFGKGWKRGYLPVNEEIKYLKRSKIGTNIHNSTGPINFRTYYLPANGVMQICDNKSYLGKIYELGKEVIGFDSINECIDMCKYYLVNDEERKKIASNGLKRVMKDYTEVAVFNKIVNLIEKYNYREKSFNCEYNISLKQKRKNLLKSVLFKYRIYLLNNHLIKSIITYILNVIRYKF